MHTIAKASLQADSRVEMFRESMNITQNQAKMAPNSVPGASSGPSVAKRSPKSGPKHPKRTPRRSESTLGDPQGHPKRDQGPPKTLSQDRFDAPKDPSRPKKHARAAPRIHAPTFILLCVFSLLPLGEFFDVLFVATSSAIRVAMARPNRPHTNLEIYTPAGLWPPRNPPTWPKI